MDILDLKKQSIDRLREVTDEMKKKLKEISTARDISEEHAMERDLALDHARDELDRGRDDLASAWMAKAEVHGHHQNKSMEVVESLLAEFPALDRESALLLQAIDGQSRPGIGES